MNKFLAAFTLDVHIQRMKTQVFAYKTFKEG